jgi:hypothetical protein
VVVKFVAALKVEVADGTHKVIGLQLSEAIVFEELAQTYFAYQS